MTTFNPITLPDEGHMEASKTKGMKKDSKDLMPRVPKGFCLEEFCMRTQIDTEKATQKYGWLLAPQAGLEPATL